MLKAMVLSAFVCANSLTVAISETPSSKLSDGTEAHQVLRRGDLVFESETLDLKGEFRALARGSEYLEARFEDSGHEGMVLAQKSSILSRSDAGAQAHGRFNAAALSYLLDHRELESVHIVISLKRQAFFRAAPREGAADQNLKPLLERLAHGERVEFDLLPTKIKVFVHQIQP